MNTHSYDPTSVFCCRSSFTPKPVITLLDPIPESVKEERKKDKGFVYLPGERLLLSLSKQKPKAKIPLDVDRLSESLNRVLRSL